MKPSLTPENSRKLAALPLLLREGRIEGCSVKTGSFLLSSPGTPSKTYLEIVNFPSTLNLVYF